VITESVPLDVANGQDGNGHGNGQDEPAAVTAGDSGKTVLGRGGTAPEDGSTEH
jgi:hypothetical protein